MPFSTGPDNSILVTGTETIDSLFSDPVNTGWLQRQGHARFYSYYNDERRIVVQSGGDFTIAQCTYTSLVNNSTTDSERRRMLIAETGGVLNIGVENTARGATLASNWSTFLNLESSDNFNNQAFSENSAILLADGGTINIFGASIDYLEGQIRSQNLGLIVFRNARIFCSSTLTALAEAARMVITSIGGAGPGSIDVDGLEVSSVGNWELNLQGNVVNFQKYTPRQVSLAFHGTSAQGSEAILTEGNGQNNGADISVQGNGQAPGTQLGEFPYFQAINDLRGNDIFYSTKGIVTGNIQNGYGLIEGKIDISGSTIDSVGSPVDSVGIYLIDSNNGERNNPLTGTGPHPQTGINYDNDQEYTEFTNVSGDYSIRTLLNVYDRRTDVDPTVELPKDVRSPYIQRVRKYGSFFIEQNYTSELPQEQEFVIRDNLNITQTEAVAQSHTGISIQEGTFNLFTKTFSIKVIGDLSVNSSLTATDIYHYLQYNLAQINTSFNGRLGGYRHELMTPSGEGFGSTASEYGGDRVVQGVAIVDENDNIFPGVVQLQADDETFFVLENTTEVEITLNPGTSSVLVLDDTETIQQYSPSETGTFTYSIPESETGTYKFLIKTPGYAFTRLDQPANGDNVTLNGTSDQDLQPDGTVMYTGSTSPLLDVSGFSDGSRVNLDVGDGAVTTNAAYSETEDRFSTQDGMLYLFNGGGRVSIAVLPGGNYFFMENNVRLRRRSPSDVNAQLSAFAISTDGQVVDGVNGGVLFLSTTDSDKIAAHQGGSVFIDVNSSNSGVAFPTGTSLQPVNNLSDAIQIANGLGLTILVLLSDLTIDEDVSNFTIKSSGNFKVANITTGVTNSTVFENSIVSGTQSGKCLFRDCILRNLSNIEGEFDRCGFDDGVSSISPSTSEIVFVDCYSTVAGSGKPVLSMLGSTDVEISIRRYSGGIDITNVTSPLVLMSIDTVGGKVTIDNSCTSGEIVVRGNSELVDNSSGTTVINDGINPLNKTASTKTDVIVASQI